MLTIEELNNRKTPIVKIDNSLKKYKDIPLFQDKIDKANSTLKKVGVPTINSGEKLANS